MIINVSKCHEVFVFFFFPNIDNQSFLFEINKESKNKSKFSTQYYTTHRPKMEQVRAPERPSVTAAEYQKTYRP